MKKELPRLIISFLIWIFLSFLFIGLSFYDFTSLEEGTSFIPGNRFFDSIVIIIIYPMLLVLIFIFIIPFIALAFVKLHKLFKFNKYSYAILKREEEKLSNSTILFRSLIASLFTFSVASILYSLIKDHSIIVATSDVKTAYIYVLVLCLILYPFILLVLTPIWLMQDSSVMASRKKFKQGRRQLPDIEGVYSIYQKFINGYIGISTVISIILLLSEELAGHPGSALIIIFAPLLMLLLLTFPVSLYDFLVKKPNKRLIQMLSKKGILIVNTVGEI